MGIVDEVMRSARSLTFSLSSPVLRQLGLSSAIENLLDRMVEPHGVEVSFESVGAGAPLPDELSTLLYRSVRELLLNVVKHARARRVGVVLRQTLDQIEILVEDDGVGFDVGRLPHRLDADGGFGLFSIRHGLGHVGGSIDVDSSPGRGTRATLEMPASDLKGADGMTIRLLMADDHALFSAGLRSLMAEHADLEVVGEVRDGRAAVERAIELEPDVVLMDISMPELDGLEGTRRIKELRPASKVLCLSMHADKEFVGAALRAGASGYLVKDGAVDELVRAIRVVANGRIYLSPEVAETVVASYRSTPRPTLRPAALSERECEVLRLLAEGLSTKEIAARLGLSVKTIASHREHLMQKLGIRSVAGLTRYAIRIGLVSLGADVSAVQPTGQIAEHPAQLQAEGLVGGDPLVDLLYEPGELGVVEQRLAELPHQHRLHEDTRGTRLARGVVPRQGLDALDDPRAKRLDAARGRARSRPLRRREGAAGLALRRVEHAAPEGAHQLTESIELLHATAGRPGLNSGLASRTTYQSPEPEEQVVRRCGDIPSVESCWPIRSPPIAAAWSSSWRSVSGWTSWQRPRGPRRHCAGRRSSEPDAVVVDVASPCVGGIETVRRLAAGPAEFA